VVHQNGSNVGIGTTDPSFGGAVGSRFSLSNADGQTGFAIGNATTPRMAINGNSNGSFTLYDYAAGSWRAGITQKSGTVGIGTMDPSFGGAVGSRFSLSNTDGQTGFAIGNATTPRMAINGNSNGSFTFYDYAAGSFTAGITQKSGNVGIGNPNPTSRLHVLNNATASGVTIAGDGVASECGGGGCYAVIGASSATSGSGRGVYGTAAGPGGTAVFGYATASSGAAIGVQGRTDSATGFGGFFLNSDGNGKALAAASPAGTEIFTVRASGNVGVGISNPATNLQVFGDMRVGTSGTNGCLQRFDGTAIAGTCSSDGRLKKNVRPFAPMLDRLVQLGPVTYNWRADEFPEYHFGASQASGLIAQEVEQVFPGMVSTDGRGYKAVNYSELPLLLLQAVRELNAENDSLADALREQQEMIRELRAEMEELRRRGEVLLSNTVRPAAR
ncbi:MAG: tail fiber domain-containing protein, partial [Acidobacteria bacterium]|nr:tail fiber domain-containing protein [Acidobacteriota bacterium]